MLKTGDNSSIALAKLLPPRQEIATTLDLSKRIFRVMFNPQGPYNLTMVEIDRFLSDVERNAILAPDALGRLFAILAMTPYYGSCDQRSGPETRNIAASPRLKIKCFVAASMQALRNASFMSEPTLHGVETLLILVIHLSGSGQPLDAWSLFGTTIRLAHLIDLHRDPTYLLPVPPPREHSVRRYIWWKMLCMDWKFSLILQKPLGISCNGDCPPPNLCDVDPSERRLYVVATELTLLARKIIIDGKDISKERSIDYTTRLTSLWETLPSTLRYENSWAGVEMALPPWPLDIMSASIFADIQTLIMMMNNGRLGTVNHSRHLHLPLSGKRVGSYPDSAGYSSPRRSDLANLGLILGSYGPVIGNWCWITSEYLGLRYALGHVWRIAVFLFTVTTYTLHAMEAGVRRDGRITPAGAEYITLGANVQDTAAGSNTQELNAKVLAKPPANVPIEKISILQSVFGKCKGPAALRPNCRNSKNRYGRAVLLHGYPLMYIILWIPGKTNRIMEALGTVPLWLEALQALTQFVGLANVLTYAISQRINEKFMEWYRVKNRNSTI
ncbi:hypothetical protein MBLNU13_g09121t1 [Cladosporium sp. NU13]